MHASDGHRERPRAGGGGARGRVRYAGRETKRRKTLERCIHNRLYGPGEEISRILNGGTVIYLARPLRTADARGNVLSRTPGPTRRILQFSRGRIGIEEK